LTAVGVSAVPLRSLISPLPIPIASVPAALTLATSPGASVRWSTMRVRSTMSRVRDHPSRARRFTHK
jgi:hypothetical protein